MVEITLAVYLKVKTSDHKPVQFSLVSWEYLHAVTLFKYKENVRKKTMPLALAGGLQHIKMDITNQKTDHLWSLFIIYINRL